jgi:hypothetical protein
VTGVAIGEVDVEVLPKVCPRQHMAFQQHVVHHDARRWGVVQDRRPRLQEGGRTGGLPRRAEVPFDSEYKFVATFHDCPDRLIGGTGNDLGRMRIWLEVDQPEALGPNRAEGDDEIGVEMIAARAETNSPRKYRREDQRQRGNTHGVISHGFTCHCPTR